MKKQGFSRKDFLKTGALIPLAMGTVLAGTGTSIPKVHPEAKGTPGNGSTGPGGSNPGIAAPGQSPSRSEEGDAKNVIFLVSDGMSAGTMALAELTKQQQHGSATHWMQLYTSGRSFHRGVMDMASLDSSVTDSAAAASSWGSGRRINNGAVNFGPAGEHYKPLVPIFRDAGKSTGLVTTTRITHATPAGFAANVASRDMEDEIAAQYAERLPDVLLGGGRRHFMGERRSDGRDLLAHFRANGYAVAHTTSEMVEAPYDAPLLGLFHDSHLPFMVDYASDPELRRSIPTLAAMTAEALKRLDRNENGFLLQVEGGRVDHAAHANDPAGLVFDQLAFDEVIDTVLRFTEGRTDTLVILTTDHGNANPGLSGLGSGYRQSPRMMETLQGYRHSFEWLYGELGYHWSMDALPNVSESRVREVVEAATNTQLTREQTRMVTQAFKGEYRAPFIDRQSPGAVLAGVLANYNGIYFIGTNHTADFVELAAWGPGADRLPAFVRNTDLFELAVHMAGVREWA